MSVRLTNFPVLEEGAVLAGTGGLSLLDGRVLDEREVLLVEVYALDIAVLAEALLCR